MSIFLHFQQLFNWKLLDNDNNAFESNNDGAISIKQPNFNNEKFTFLSPLPHVTSFSCVLEATREKWIYEKIAFIFPLLCLYHRSINLFYSLYLHLLHMKSCHRQNWHLLVIWMLLCAYCHPLSSSVSISLQCVPSPNNAMDRWHASFIFISIDSSILEKIPLFSLFIWPDNRFVVHVVVTFKIIYQK